MELHNTTGQEYVEHSTTALFSPYWSFVILGNPLLDFPKQSQSTIPATIQYCRTVSHHGVQYCSVVLLIYSTISSTIPQYSATVLLQYCGTVSHRGVEHDKVGVPVQVSPGHGIRDGPLSLGREYDTVPAPLRQALGHFSLLHRSQFPQVLDAQGWRPVHQAGAALDHTTPGNITVSYSSVHKVQLLCIVQNSTMHFCVYGTVL